MENSEAGIAPRQGGVATARRGLLALPVSVGAVVGAFFLSTGSTLPPATAPAAKARPAVDADLCPKEGPVRRRAVYLVDLRKPLDAGLRARPGELLDRLAIRLGKDDELTVFAVSEHALAPRIPLGRLCRPYAAADVARATTKARVAADGLECGKLPVQLPRTTREAAKGFCGQRRQLRARVDDLAARGAAPATRAYLAEAIDETVAELALHASATTVHVFSDMFQEGDWYSHEQLDWRRWSFAHFAAERQHAIGLAPPQPAAFAAAVEVFYLPRPGSTARTEVRKRHQAFWAAYFAAHGLRGAFRDQLL